MNFDTFPSFSRVDYVIRINLTRIQFIKLLKLFLSKNVNQLILTLGTRFHEIWVNFKTMRIHSCVKGLREESKRKVFIQEP